jgi:hypothetical protein
VIWQSRPEADSDAQGENGPALGTPIQAGLITVYPSSYSQSQPRLQC